MTRSLAAWAPVCSPELVTNLLHDYEAAAVALARDPYRISAIRSKLAGNRKTYPLFDTSRLVRHLEAAYATMWSRYRREEAPESFTVTRSDYLDDRLTALTVTTPVKPTVSQFPDRK